MHNERYPMPVENFEGWYTARMKEITGAQTPQQIDASLALIRHYADARWCFPNRLSDAEAAASKIRRLRGWKRASFSDPTTGEIS